MYAVDDLGDAIDLTREFLTPVDPWTWIKLAVVIFFVATLGLAGPPTPPGEVTVTEDPFADTELEGEFEIDLTLADVLAILALVLVVGVLLWLAYALVGAIMEFVLLESLRSTTVHVRAYGRANLGRALHLFVFRATLALVGLAIVVGPAASLLSEAETLDDVAIGSLVTIGLVGFGYYLLYGLLIRLTTEFVAPIMLLEERGILNAWGRFWPTLVSSWDEYLVYVVIVTVFTVLVGIVVSMFAAFVGILVGIPTLVVAVLLVVTAGTVGGVLAVVVVLFGLALFVFLLALVQVPVVTYIRYYALLVLGDTNPDLDLIPQQRTAVRAASSGPGRGRRDWDETGSERDHDYDRDRTRDRDDRWSTDTETGEDEWGAGSSNWNADGDARDEDDERR